MFRMPALVLKSGKLFSKKSPDFPSIKSSTVAGNDFNYLPFGTAKNILLSKLISQRNACGC